MTTFKAKVSENSLLCGSFQYVHLELLEPHLIEFQAGQYIIIAVDKEKGIRRNYSIASPSSMSHAIEILVDIKPAGDGSLYLANLAPGDEIEFIAPFGNFIIPAENPHEELIFVATGSGISPIRSMIVSELVDRRSQKQIRLWWGMRYEKDCFWVEDFDDLEKEHQNFEWDLVLSKPPDEWPLHSGYVTAHVLDYVQNRAKGQGIRDKGKTNLRFPLAFSPKPLALNVCFYLCGSRQMIEDVSTGLTKLGITSDQIRYEKFF